MTGLHVDDVLRGGPDAGAIPINVPNDLPISLRKQIGVDRLRLILLDLASYANDKSVAYPSVRTIAAETGIQERKVRVGLEILQLIGLVTRVAAAIPGRRGVSYRLHLPSVEGGQSIEKDESTTSPRTSTRTQSRTHSLTPSPTQISTVECGEEKQEEEQKRKAQRELDYVYCRFADTYPRHGLNGQARIAFYAAAAVVPSWQIMDDLRTDLEGLGDELRESFPLAKDWLNQRYLAGGIDRPHAD